MSSPWQAEPVAQPRVLLSIAFPFAKVGPAAVGGAEVVLSQLDAAMGSLGFRSVVVARAGSSPVGILYPTFVPEGEIDDALRAVVEREHQRQIDRALADHPVALVHLHGLDFGRYRLPPGLPVVVTVHLPPSWYPAALWECPPNYHLVCVSETQRAACPAFVRDRLTVIGNGVPLPDPASLRPSGRYALMLSRLCPEKNLHTGLDAAKRAGLPVLLAGEVFPYPEHERYFREEIEPRLTAGAAVHVPRGAPTSAVPEARFLGPVTGAAKARLLSRAACLLQPSLAPETSSLVAMEALAAGIPVVAVASGALPEIVEHGRTGLLVPPEGDLENALAEALGQIVSGTGFASRAVCRATAEARFALATTLAAYGALYRQLALAHPVRAALPAKPLRMEPVRLEPAPLTAHPLVDQPSVATLEGFAALARFEGPWERLWARDDDATPFQHPAWLLPWARQFGPDGVLHLVVLEHSATDPVALLPCFAYTEDVTGLRKLLLLGAGTADYLGGIFPTDSTAVSFAGLALQAAVRIPGIDRVDLSQLRGRSPLVEAAAALFENPPTPAEPCAVIAVAKPLPPRLAANLRRYNRRAREAHPAPCALQFSVASTAQEAAASFEELRLLHSRRWQERSQTGVLGDARVLQHHREALPALLAAGLLHLFHLRSGTETLAVLYALGDPPQRPLRRLYLYLIGIETGRSDWSPGSLMLEGVRDYAQREGFTLLDLLRGGEAYKSLWGAEPEATYALSFRPDTLSAAASSS